MTSEERASRFVNEAIPLELGAGVRQKMREAITAEIRAAVAEERETIAILEEQLKVATSRAQRFRDALMRIFDRADDYSATDIRANIADALESTVKELLVVEGLTLEGE